MLSYAKPSKFAMAHEDQLRNGHIPMLSTPNSTNCRINITTLGFWYLHHHIPVSKQLSVINQSSGLTCIHWQ